jgi:sporulation protein YlmC with PRC-barrel domain
MVFVADLTYPDNIPDGWPVVQAGEAIQKGWQIQNTGTCTWDETYALIYSGSQPAGVLQGDPVYIQGTVAPGGVYDIYVDVQTPDEAGRYVGYYSMQAPGGALFGDRIWVAVEVTSESVITESPTPEAPAPTLELVASPTASQSPPTVTVVPSASGWPPQTNAAEIRPAEMRAELTILSNLLGFQVIDINGAPLGVATDYVINTCETYIIHISMDPDEAVSAQAGMRMMLPFEMVTINSGVLDAETNSIGMYLPFEPFPPAPIVPDTMNLTPTDWEPGVLEYWNQFVRLGVLTTACVVTDPVSGEPVPVYKTAYASELLGATLRDGIGNELGTVVDAILEPESGKLHFYVIELIDNQGLTLAPLGATNIPKEVLDSGAEISLVLLTENDKLLNAPRYDSLEEATSGGAIKAAFEYW